MTKRLWALLGLMLLVSCIVTAADSGTLPPTPLPPEMVFIPAGSFYMGDIFGDGWPDELPVHTVAVSAFAMDRYEITKALWDEVASWAAANGYDIGPTDGEGKAADHPVYNVTWYEAVKWANARSEKERLTPCYYTDSSQRAVCRTGNTDVSNDGVMWTANGYRLPTEAEWEKAARGGAAGRRYPWGASDEIDASRANYDVRYGGTTPVGIFAPNGYGLYDMAGNVEEWCWDWYGESTYASSPGSDPRGPALGSRRVDRGGGWLYREHTCRVALRLHVRPDADSFYLGFRLVRTAP